jgi:peptide subunit release factor 1 (eRF1)
MECFGIYDTSESHMTNIMERSCRMMGDFDGIHVVLKNLDLDYHLKPKVKKTAHWIPWIGDDKGEYECSSCHWVSPKLEKSPEEEYMNYCPCCGIKIDHDWEDGEYDDIITN